MYDSSSELQGTKTLHTWRIEKQGKGNNHESGDDRKQDDQTGINFHPAAEISINLEKSRRPLGQELCPMVHPPLLGREAESLGLLP